MPDSAAFAEYAEPFRRELFAHCYRLLGSVSDAEDLVQETYLRAWRSYEGFEGRSSMRTWLYRIATNACLTALAKSARRMLPSGLGAPEPDPGVYPELADPEIAWLDPVPDTMVVNDTADPADIVAARAGLRLALIASMQYLPPRQCELCEHGATVAVHQVAGLASLGRPGPGQPAWAALMAKMRRKTLIVCASCHDWIHANPVAHAA